MYTVRWLIYIYIGVVEKFELSRGKRGKSSYTKALDV